MTNPSARKCLVILGMHRSGTSSLAGALQFTGFDLGKDIMPPADENPKGFFENMKIVSLNDKILEELFTFWSDTLFIPEDWWKSDRFKEFAGRIRTILQEEFNSDMPILIKDPRLSVLLPLYLEVFEDSGIKPVFLICVRNPIEVANSLSKRNNLSLEKSFLLWMDYHLKAELYSRDLPRIFVSYADFLSDPLKIISNVRESFIPEMRIDHQIEKEVLSFCDPALSHRALHEHIPGHSQLPELSELYDIHNEAGSRDFTAEEKETIDRIRSRFSGMVRFYNGLPENYLATLSVQFDNGGQTILSSPVIYGHNELRFTINPDKQVSKIVLRPCNARVGLKLVGIDALLIDHSVIKFDNITTNAASKTADGFMIFDTDLPKISINCYQSLSISRIDFSLEYLAFGTMPCRKALKKPSILSENKSDAKQTTGKKSEKQDNEFLKMQELISKQKLEIEKIHKSLTWRIGRIITRPARMFRKY